MSFLARTIERILASRFGTATEKRKLSAAGRQFSAIAWVAAAGRAVQIPADWVFPDGGVQLLFVGGTAGDEN
jgi:hypothetical protein